MQKEKSPTQIGLLGDKNMIKYLFDQHHFTGQSS
jgi:hypothetical protein